MTPGAAAVHEAAVALPFVDIFKGGSHQ